MLLHLLMRLLWHSSAVAERVVSVNLGFTFKVCCNNSLCSLCCYKVKSGICYYECCPKTNTSRGRPSSPPSLLRYCKAKIVNTSTMLHIQTVVYIGNDGSLINFVSAHAAVIY